MHALRESPRPAHAPDVFRSRALYVAPRTPTHIAGPDQASEVTLVRSSPEASEETPWFPEETSIDPLPAGRSAAASILDAALAFLERIGALVAGTPVRLLCTVPPAVFVLALFAIAALAPAPRSAGARVVLVAPTERACAAVRALAAGRRDEALAIYRSLEPAETGCPEARSILEQEP